jgi:hypothetical protein
MAATRIANRKTAPRLVKTDEPSIADEGYGQLAYLSACLTGAQAIVEGLDDFDRNDELIHLAYLIEFAEDYAEKARVIFDNSVRRLEHPEVAHA